MATNSYGIVQKKWLTAFILSLFLGVFGIDRFYLGKAGTGLLKLLTLGGFGLWALIDFILIASKSMRGVEWVNEGKNDKRTAWIIFAIAIALGIIVNAANKPSDNQNSTGTITQETNTASIAIDQEEQSPAPEFAEPKTYEGNGDDIIDIGSLTDPRIVTFECSACSGNTSAKTNGAESLLVNEIGPYKGRHLINLQEGSLTTEVTITADAPWKLTITDLNEAKQLSSASASGSGDEVIYVSGSTTKATITNEGESNFAVHVYPESGGFSDLPVNTIGSYRGTVPLDAPAYVQITSNGTWSLTTK